MRTLGVIVALHTCMLTVACGQALTDPAGSSNAGESRGASQIAKAYQQPTRKVQFHDYVKQAFGAYPIAGAAFASGVNQLTDSPPEWRQGVAGYGKRFGSNLGIAAVGTTTRYGLAQVLNEDTSYYPCTCSGVMPRLRHAVVSTLTGRRGKDGHHVFSVPALVAPYAGSMTAIYVWYPNRFEAKDGFRMGNYGLLWYMGGNIALEFLRGKPGSLLARFHLGNAHGAAEMDLDN